MFIFLWGRVAIGSSHRQFREKKSDCFFDVLCSDTDFSLSWRHGRDGLENMVN